jgi:hypothetical protein
MIAEIATDFHGVRIQNFWNLEQVRFGAVTLLTSRLGFQYLYGDLSKHDPEPGKEWK